MKINHDDLVAYLNESEDWRSVGEHPLWLNFEGPLDAVGVPLHIVIPVNHTDPSSAIYLQTAVATLAALAEIDKQTMADRITSTSVKALLDAIKRFDCEPAVFYVNVTASDHQADYTASVEFRTGTRPTASAVSAHGDTPEDALQDLLTVLKAKWGRCPRCGQHLDSRTLPPNDKKYKEEKGTL